MVFLVLYFFSLKNYILADSTQYAGFTDASSRKTLAGNLAERIGITTIKT